MWVLQEKVLPAEFFGLLVARRKTLVNDGVQGEAERGMNILLNITHWSEPTGLCTAGHEAVLKMLRK